MKWFFVAFFSIFLTPIAPLELSHLLHRLHKYILGLIYQFFGFVTAVQIAILFLIHFLFLFFLGFECRLDSVCQLWSDFLQNLLDFLILLIVNVGQVRRLHFLSSFKVFVDQKYDQVHADEESKEVQRKVGWQHWR